MQKALYRKHNDRSLNSSKYHKLDGTPIRAILKRESEEIISESLDREQKKEYNSGMKTLNQQIIRIAQEHGFKAEENASGGVNVHIEFIDKNDNLGIETFPVNNLHQLKIALGY